MAYLIGTAANQVPVNGMLGGMAYQEAANYERVIGNRSEVNLGNSGTTKTIDWASGKRQVIVLDQNTTLSFSFTGCQVGNYLLRISQNATGGYGITWSTNTPGTTKWLGVVGSPILNSAASSISFASFYWDGTNSYGSMGMVNAL